MMYDRLKQLVLEAALPVELGGRTIANKYKNPLGIPTRPNTSRASRTSSTQETEQERQEKEAEKKKLAAQEKIGGAVKALGAGALVGNALSKMQNLQGATKRKAAPGSLV